jgi:2-oxoglutarate ferredoxin oxidoreductase subunit beta
MNKEAGFAQQSPMAEFLRMERMPHIWCPGCGIGTVVNSFAEAVKKSGLDMDKIAVVSGIGCTGRVAGYVRFDSFHSTHGRAIPLATGLKLANPDLKVVVFSGDGDLFGIGGNHFIHAARRNMDIVVVCVNNFTYGMTGGQLTPTTPSTANASTTPYGNYEYPFSLPFLADASGATYVARWTSLHARNITSSMLEALNRKGFSFIEVITPCTTLYARRNRLGDGLDALQYYHDDAEIKHGADTRTVDIGYQSKIVVGKFVDREKSTYLEAVNARYANVLGDDYQLYGKTEIERKEEAKQKAKESKEAKAKAKPAEPKARTKPKVKVGPGRAVVRTKAKKAAKRVAK